MHHPSVPSRLGFEELPWRQNGNLTIGMELQQMSIARDDHLSVSFKSAFQNTVIIRINAVCDGWLGRAISAM